MTRLDPATARWLVSYDGLRFLDGTRAALRGGRDVLEVGTELREGGLAPERAAAVTAIAATGGELLGDPEGVEQSSHPLVARWRARRFRACDLVVDLCAGIGGDAVAIAGDAGRVVAVESDEARATFLRANVDRAGVDVATVVGDAVRPPLRVRGAVHADPSRRRDGRRARRLRDYSPPVGALDVTTAGARARAFVLSPGVDLEDPDLPEGELEFIEVDGALVEAVVWTGDLRGGDASATLLPDGNSRRREGAVDRLPVGDVGEWLLDPAAAAVRARLHDSIGAEVGARRIARRRALLTCDDEPPPSPWYRARRVEAVLPVRARAARDWLRAAEPRPLEIATHGLDIDPDGFWRALGRPERGPNGRRIELVRLDRGAAAIVCADPPR